MTRPCLHSLGKLCLKAARRVVRKCWRSASAYRESWFAHGWLGSLALQDERALVGNARAKLYREAQIFDDVLADRFA